MFTPSGAKGPGVILMQPRTELSTGNAVLSGNAGTPALAVLTRPSVKLLQAILEATRNITENLPGFLAALAAGQSCRVWIQSNDFSSD